MEAMKSFLIDAFNVPEGSTLDIRELKNEEATRANIIAEICKLKDDDLVKKNDAILIYYAGHGARMPPPKGWPGYSSTPPTPEGWPEDIEIQCIVASDAVVSKENQNYYVSGVVLDRTLAALLHDLADERGNNIVCRLIYSSTFPIQAHNLPLHRPSFSTAATLAPVRATLVLYAVSNSKTLRGSGSQFEATMITEYGRSSLAAELWLTTSIVTLALVPMFFSPPVAPKKRRQIAILLRRLSLNIYKQPHSMLSHMLFSLETLIQRNVFCKSLVSIYRNNNSKTEQHSSSQHPICEGNSKNSMLFDLKEINLGRLTFDVVKENGNLFLCAGAILGITPGTQFAVYTSKVFTITSTFIGNFIVTDVGTTTSSLKGTQAELDSVEHNSAVASPTTHSQSKFSVHVADESILSCVKAAIAEETSEDQYGRPQLSTDGLADNADLILLPYGNEINFLHPPLSEVGKFGLGRLYFTLPQDPSRIRRVLRAAAHFFKYLRHEPRQSLLQSEVKVYICELEETDDYESGPAGIRREMRSKRRLEPGKHGEIEVKVAEARVALTTAPAYGIEILNGDRNANLFAWAFFFDCSTLEISEYWAFVLFRIS